MRQIILPLLVMLSIAAGPAFAKSSSGKSRSDPGGSHRVKGYVSKSGKYVAPNYAKNPNRTQRGNYSTQGNRNPYSSKAGTKRVKK